MGNSEIIALTGVAAESIYEECQNVNIRSICNIYIYIYILDEKPIGLDNLRELLSDKG